MTSAALSQEFLARLLAFVRRRVRSAADAEDILQDTLVKLVERRGEVRDESVPAWLFTVARRAIIDRYRASAATPLAAPEGEEPVVSPELAGDEEGSAARELARCLAPFLEELADEDRELLRRVDAEGESQAEIARSLAVSPSTVKSRVQRARAKLLDRLTRCCEIALDGRGLPLEYRRRPETSCGCDGECD